jgi:predicted DNA-binding protein
MYTKRQKRPTKIVRLGIEWHKRVKLLAIEKGIVMSKLMDEIVEKYFEQEFTSFKGVNLGLKPEEPTKPRAPS